MLVLFDNGTPRTLARYLIEHHTVTEARARGWEAGRHCVQEGRTFSLTAFTLVMPRMEMASLFI